MTTSITVAYGDYPEMMEAALHVLREAGADLAIETIEVGQRVYNMGGPAGILPGAWDSILRTGVVLKSPTIAPPDDRFSDVGEALRHGMELDGSNRSLQYWQFGASSGIEILASPAFIADATLIAATSSHISDRFALFETHTNATNVSSMLLAASHMLNHIEQNTAADRIHKAWKKTLLTGIYPPGLHSLPGRKQKADLDKFSCALIDRLYS